MSYCCCSACSDEHAVLSAWIRQRPPGCAKGINADEAGARLGFEKEANHYRRIDAAAAFIVIKRAEAQLPQWAAHVRETVVSADVELRSTAQVRLLCALRAPLSRRQKNVLLSDSLFTWPVGITLPSARASE
jgi:hypothetical protein